MLKQKNTFATKASYQRHLGIGVFLLVIVLMWFIGFKIIGNTSSIDSGESGTVGEESNTEEAIKKVFSDKNDYPVFIMFDNHPDSQKYLSGLHEALVVYELLAEGGATRFAGLFAGAPKGDKIGPIRSARPYIVETASGWSSFFWHAGGSPEALELIPKTDVVDLNEISGLGVKYFWRDNDIIRPHNLFTSASLITLGLADFKLNKLPLNKLFWKWEEKESNGFVLSDQEKEKLVTSIYIDFSEDILFDANYEYDTGLGVYKRFMGGVEHKDSATNNQLVASNIIVQRVPQETYYSTGYGRIKIDMVGSGEALVFKHGEVIQGTWEKETQDSQTIWLNEIGEPIQLARGQTWVEILPGDRIVTYE